jgi:3-ketosteroid 9alpha-monooxygenase subunit B
MQALYRLRILHAALGIGVIAAYLTGEEGTLHTWLGYGVAAIIVVRIAFAFGGAPQLGLFRFYPHFEGLKLGNLATHPAVSKTLLLVIALSLLTTTATGLLMDRGRTIGLAASGVVATALADEDEGASAGRGAEDDAGEDQLGEIHELSANLLIIFVALHVSYLAIFKRPLALFMIFARTPRAKP